MPINRSELSRQRCRLWMTSAGLCLCLATAAFAESPLLRLKSRTLLKDGEISPSENAVYVRREGVDMITPYARSADNGRTGTAFRSTPDFDSGLRKGFRRAGYPGFVDPVEDRLVSFVLALDVPDLDPNIVEPPIGENEYYLRYRVPMRRWTTDYKKFRGVEYVVEIGKPN